MTTKRTTVAMAAQDVRPGRIVIEDDGRTRRVRDVKYGNETVVLVYTAGPCDVYRRTYMLDVVPVPERAAWDTTVFATVGPLDPCVNCGQELPDHDRNERSACQSEHLAHLGVK